MAFLSIECVTYLVTEGAETQRFADSNRPVDLVPVDRHSAEWYAEAPKIRKVLDPNLFDRFCRRLSSLEIWGTRIP